MAAAIFNSPAPQAEPPESTWCGEVETCDGRVRLGLKSAKLRMQLFLQKGRSAKLRMQLFLQKGRFAKLRMQLFFQFWKNREQKERFVSTSL